MKKYRETSSRFSLGCFVINVYIFVLDKTAGFGWRHFILTARFLLQLRLFWPVNEQSPCLCQKTPAHLCSLSASDLSRGTGSKYSK